MRTVNLLVSILFSLIIATPLLAGQPAIGSSPGEPDWKALLAQQWSLDVDRDLRNPVIDGVIPRVLLRAADKNKPVTFTPLIALGLETKTHADWYNANSKANNKVVRLWSYQHKQPAKEIEAGLYTAPPIEGNDTFKPGDAIFGLHLSNDEFTDGGVFLDPSRTAHENARLKSQPYKAMIYPNYDPKTKHIITNSYLIGWEYSTNDDFQDVVTRVDNVRLVTLTDTVPGAVTKDSQVRKLAAGFEFVEGPAWDHKNNALYFSDIPRAQIVRYADNKTSIARNESGQSNGLMFDKDGTLVACEHAKRRVSRGLPDGTAVTIVDKYKGKRLNSPNDLWIDQQGGIYFTDPRYGKRDNMEQDVEGVYYVAPDKTITRIIDNLVRPNGIALSPDGQWLYVLDNGADLLYRYAIKAPGKIDKGECIAKVRFPDGMTVDAKGRLYATANDGVWVLDANGKWLGMIETPAQPANCTFGGKDNATLFITARKELFAIDTQTRGWHVHLDGVPSHMKK